MNFSALPIETSPRILSTICAMLLLLTCQTCMASRPFELPEKNEQRSLHYVVDLADAKNHYVTISVDVPATGKTTELMMAVWTPGSYLIREYARHINTLVVTADDGKKLSFEKTRKNRWTVQTKGIKRFKVSYRLYCNELSVRTNWLDRQFAILTGAATFVTSPELLKNPHVVQLKMPTGWTRSATSLSATGDAPHTFTASNFDELVDSPIVAGNIDVFPFTAGGIEHQLVNVGDSGYWDGTKAATDLKRVVEEHQRMWGVVPYDRYLFLNIICESRGGLEHNNSTLIMTSRWGFRDEAQYKNWLTLASHEFFHTWNVRRLRPKSLVEYDYENEVYTESLWIAEGITSYYEDLAVVRAGLISQKEYFEKLSANIVSIQQSNGRRVESLKDSSYDAWIKFYRPDENSSNTRTNYYSKGAVVAFLLDIKIRKLTKGKKSLDDVMRQMFESFVESGYTPKDFRQTASDVAGHDLNEWFRTAVDSTDELDYSDVAWLGLKVPGIGPANADVDDQNDKRDKTSDENKENDARKKADSSPKTDSETRASKSGDDSPKLAAEKKKVDPKPWLGLRAGGDGRLMIVGIESNSPATVAGLNTGDEIIAINNYRVSSSIEGRLKQFKVGDEINLLISRRDELFEVPIVIGTSVELDWKLKPVAKPGKNEQKHLNAWLIKKDVAK